MTVAFTSENRNCLYPKSQLKNDFHEDICPEEENSLKEGQNKIKRDKNIYIYIYKQQNEQGERPKSPNLVGNYEQKITHFVAETAALYKTPL